MFEEFLYTLRRGGLKVSLTEWMALMEALEKGLHGSSFTGFYHLCRALLVKSEADFDRFDRCFLQYFKDVPFEQEVSQELLEGHVLKILQKAAVEGVKVRLAFHQKTAAQVVKARETGAVEPLVHGFHQGHPLSEGHL